MNDRVAARRRLRIAYLCKRRYTGKDVIGDRYGRLYEIPRQLARLGHQLRCYCLDYKLSVDGNWVHEAASGTLQWNSRSVRNIFGLAGYAGFLCREFRSFQPDLVIGASDIPHVAMARWLSRKFKVPLVVDLYDNFESFAQARIPGFPSLLISATREADLVLAVSCPLKSKVETGYYPGGQVALMPNGIDRSIFRPADQDSARRALGLPLERTLVGTAGYLSSEKGVDTLYKSWPLIADTIPNADLVLAGPIDPRLPPPDGIRVHYLGHLSQECVATLFSALDVGVVTVPDNEFGRFCFPQKAYEMRGCNLPIVATKVGVMASMLEGQPDSLYLPGDSFGLAVAVERQLARPDVVSGAVPEWSELIAGVEPMISALTPRVGSHLASGEN